MGMPQVSLGCMRVRQEGAVHTHNILSLSHRHKPISVYMFCSCEFSFISDGASDSSSDTEYVKLHA
jgi:hypothetical protein